MASDEKPIIIRFDQANTKPSKTYREDFWDAESRGITPQRFADTQPQFTPGTEIQDYDMLDNLYHKSGLAHKVVSKPAEDATRNGWRIVIPDSPDKQAEYQKAMDKLALKQVLSQELIYQRLHGDGYISIGTDYEDGVQNNNNDKININVLKNIPFVHAFGQKHVRKNITSNDPTSENYMQETSLIVDQTQESQDHDANGQPKLVFPKIKPIQIDRSRYFHISLDKLEDDTTGVSILKRCWDSLKALDTGLYSAGKMLYAFDINVITSQGFASDTTMSDKSFDSETKTVKDSMGTDSVLMLNNGQGFNRYSAATGGIDSLYQFAWQNLAASSNIPKSVLLGEQAGTLAGASQDVANYYDGVKAMQEELLRPQIEYIVKLLMYSSDIAGGRDDPDNLDWKIEFNPLWSQDDHTNSETFQTIAAGIAQLINTEVLDPDQGRQILQSMNNNMVGAMNFPQTKNALNRKLIQQAHQQAQNNSPNNPQPPHKVGNTDGS